MQKEERNNKIETRKLFESFRNAVTQSLSNKFKAVKNTPNSKVWSSNSHLWRKKPQLEEFEEYIKETPTEIRLHLKVENKVSNNNQDTISLTKRPITSMSQRYWTYNPGKDDQKVLLRGPFTKEALTHQLSKLLEFIAQEIPDIDKDKFIEVMKQKIKPPEPSPELKNATEIAESFFIK